MVVYLADTSIWSWADNDPDSSLAQKLATRIDGDEVATCPVVVLEFMHRARDPEECQVLLSRLSPLHVVPISGASGERAVDVQQGLAKGPHGNHRRPAADFLIAAAAEEAGPDVTLWFFDKDLRVICEHTGQPYEAETKS